MNNFKKWQEGVFAVFEKIKKHNRPYNIKFGNLQITVLPNVFSPKYFTDSFWFAEQVSKLVKNKSLLEIGTGTGIIAITCAIKEARVVATDINPTAVKNAKLNAKKYGLDIKIRKGDIYSTIKEAEKFEFIFWNHPFNNWKLEVKEVLLKAGFDTEYKSLKTYISEAHKHLTLDGRLLLGTGDGADIKEIKKIAQENNYGLKLLKETTLPITEGGNIKNKYLIYEFVALI
ncbi:MAG: methyltransferase [Patescibacteria group bacterium]